MRVVFMGSPDFAIAPLRALASAHEVCSVVTQPDRPKGRGQSVTMPAVKHAALDLKLPVHQPTKVRDGSFAEYLRAQNAELAVVVAYGRILPPPVLRALPLGCLNIHASLLPRHRGAAPIQWSILSGDSVTGVSIMQLDEGMDTGAVFLRTEIPIGAEETSGDLFDSLAPLGAQSMLQVLEQIEAGTAEAKSQDHDSATHARMLTKDDGRVDWSLSAAEVSQRIRAMDPWPGAFVPAKKGNLKIFGAKVRAESGEPGVLLETMQHAVVVGCGEGACEIKQLQAPGKRRMHAADFARGRQLKTGMPLSS